MWRTIKLFHCLLMATSLCSVSAGTTRVASSSPEAQPLEVTTAVLPDLTVNHPYALHLTAKGGSNALYLGPRWGNTSTRLTP